MSEWIVWKEACHTYVSVQPFGIPWLDEVVVGALALFMLYWIVMYGPRTY